MVSTPVILYLVFFAFSGSLPVSVDGLMRKYISLISEVHNYYGTSSVLLTFCGNERRLSELTLAQLLSLDFSQKGFLTLIFDFEQLPERVKFYRGRIVRPLIVVLLRAADEIGQFIGSAGKINVSYPIWLVIFDGDYGEPMCDRCIHPVGNAFGLKFNTEMLVLCCKDATIREWWSVDRNRTEVADLATWSDDGGLRLLTNEGLYARRHVLNGTGIRAGIVTSSAFLHDHGDTVDGFLGEMLSELKRAMNFTITAMLRESGFGSWSSATDTWSGVVGYLAREEADIGVAEFTITDSRLNVVDFTLPIILSRSRLYIRQPNRSGVQWFAYFQAFSYEIWVTIIIVIMTTPILLTVIVRVKGGPIILPLILAESYLYVWGIFCQQGLSEFPAETPLRIAYISIFISALVVSAAYSASLISFLTSYYPTLPFSTMAGFADDGSYSLVVYQNSSDYDLFAASSDPILSKMMTLMKPWRDLPQTMEQGFEQVCNENVAFYATEAGKETMNSRLPCQLVVIESGRTDSLAMIMPTDSQYTGVVNYHMQRFQDHGMLNRMKRQYLIKGNPSETIHDVVSLGGVAPILSVLAGGIILALVVLVLEKVCFSLKNYRHRWKRVNVRKAMSHECFNLRGKQEVSSQILPSALENRSPKLSELIGYYP